MSKTFTLHALKNLKQTGSLFRSSKSLANKLTHQIQTDKKLIVLELGAGDGVITKHILKKMGSSSLLHSFEINPVFLSKLDAFTDSRLTIHNTCVSQLAANFYENEVDLVISCLPLTNINYSFKEQLLKDIKHILKPSGSLVQYQYSKNDLKLLQHNFSHTNTTLCIKNIPPAFIYTCKNL